MYDYHVHSSFSSDCNIDMEEMIEQAIEMGIAEICFTEHYDYDYQDPAISFEFDKVKYGQKLEFLKEKYKHQIKVLKGVEIGIQPHIISQCNDFVMGEGFDFVISSMHTSDKKDIHIGDFFKDKTPQQCYEKYYTELLICAKEFQNFNVVGHMELLKRYGHHGEIQDIRKFLTIIEELFKTLIHNGRGIEVNTSGFRCTLGDMIPSKEVLLFYKSLGGEIITTGSDAHIPNHLGYNFNPVYDLLKEIGFKYVSTFENMKPSFKKL